MHMCACTCVHIHTQSPLPFCLSWLSLLLSLSVPDRFVFVHMQRLSNGIGLMCVLWPTLHFFVLLFLFLNLLHFSFIATIMTSRFPLALLSTSRITLYGSDTQIQYYIHHSKLVEKVSDASTCIQMHCIDQA